MTNPHVLATALYRVDAVWFRYEERGARRGQAGGAAWTLQDVSFTLEPGEILGVIGPNGSGKSTLIKLMAGVQAPERGRIYLGDRCLAHVTPRQVAERVAAVFPEASIGFPFTVAEMVLMGRYPHHDTSGFGSGWAWDTRADWEIALGAMRDMEIAHLADHPIDRVSSGERQRVSLARALAQETSVILLDEPTAHLDAHHLVGFATRLRHLNRARGLSIAMVTHDLNLAALLCTRVLLLSEGRIVALGPPAAVMQTDVLESVYGRALMVTHPSEAGVPQVTLRMSPLE